MKANLNLHPALTARLRLILAVALAFLAGPAWSTVLFFSQLDFNLEGTAINNSEWGEVDLTFTGEDPILYFNLAVNGSWQVQNVPVLSREGIGVTQTSAFNFDLGVPRGTDVTSLSFAFSLTPTVKVSIPIGSTLAPIQNQSVVSFRDVGEQGVPALGPAMPLAGGQVADPTKFAQKNFPNQECGVNKCAPAAASNSLKFIKSKQNLNVADADISIAAMDGAMKNHPSGGKFRGTWWEDKKAYLGAKKIPITTKKITKLADLASEIAHGEDIELQGDWHTAAIVGVTDLGMGKFSIDVAHDTIQGAAGGTKTQTIIFNPATGKFEGSPGFFNGSTFQYAVSESVPEPNTVMLFTVGLVGLGFIRLADRRMQHMKENARL